MFCDDANNIHAPIKILSQREVEDKRARLIVSVFPPPCAGVFLLKDWLYSAIVCLWRTPNGVVADDIGRESVTFVGIH
jgi:hypothetical protein